MNHFIEYILVYVIFATGVWTIFSSTTPLIKVGIVLGLGSVYFLWAIWHHLGDHKKITIGVFMEYLSILVLVMWILFSLV